MDLKKTLAAEWQNVQELRYLHIKFDPGRCTGVWECYEVCPVGCWRPNYETGVAEFRNGQRCIACGACVLQCPQDAIQLTVD